MQYTSNRCKIALFMKARSNRVIHCLDSHSGCAMEFFYMFNNCGVYIFAILFNHLRLWCLSLLAPRQLIESNDTS